MEKRKASIQQVSDSELELMRIIWSRGGSALYAQVMEDLEAKGMEWKKNTVLTFLARLIDKKLLATKKLGHKNEYSALISEDEYLALQTQSFLDKVYEGNVGDLVSTLLRQEFITSDEIEQLRDILNRGERNQ